jgi:hypothetical protein
MISREEIVPRLLQACPTAQRAWDEHVAWWGTEDRGIYNDVAVLAHHVVVSLKSRDTRKFDAFFRVLEELLVTGDPDTRAVAVNGLIEDLQNIASHEPPGYQAFERWLHPTSRRAWADVERLWSGKESLMDVVRAERQDEEPPAG